MASNTVTVGGDQVIAGKIVCTPETLLSWVRQVNATLDSVGLTTNERQR